MLTETAIILALLLSWLLPSILVGRMASRRGRNGIKYLVLSICFSPVPFGLYLIFFARSARENAAASRTRAG